LNLDDALDKNSKEDDDAGDFAKRVWYNAVSGGSCWSCLLK
jgi:hypothetical protein